MNADVVENYVLAELVDRATDKRRLDIDADALAQLKVLCRGSDDNAAAAADLLLDRLKANDAQAHSLCIAKLICLGYVRRQLTLLLEFFVICLQPYTTVNALCMVTLLWEPLHISKQFSVEFLATFQLQLNCLCLLVRILSFLHITACSLPVCVTFTPLC